MFKIALDILGAVIVLWLVMIMMAGIASAYVELRGWGSSFRAYRRHRAEIDEILDQRKETDQ